MPVFRPHREKLKQFEDLFKGDILRKVAPFWIRNAHRVNGHWKPFYPLCEVRVSSEDETLFHDSHWRSMELHSVALLSQVVLSLENYVPLERILADLQADRPIRVSPRLQEVLSP